jgi:phospholipid/cholesterol/gamma-HCH transport system substrate-binding protein
MQRAIREHLRDFLAIAGLTVVALVAGWIIVQQERLRVPVLEDKPFELKADFETAQAVIPGQGQTVRIAGVRIGDIDKVELKNGVAQVTMAIDRKFLPIYRNATILLRPKTGLKDMFLEMDPGSRSAGTFPERATVPIANTAPDVNLDQVLESLDSDTQAYLRALLVGGGQGLKGRGKDLGKLLGNLGPLNKQLANLNGEVAKRKLNLARLIHNMNLLTKAIGDDKDELSQLVSASNSSLSAIAAEDPQVQRAVQLLGPTLVTARDTLAKVSVFARVAGPAFNDLRPFARGLVDVNKSTERLAKATTPTIKNKIRPFVRNARAPVRQLGPAAQDLAEATPNLTVIGNKLNRLVNMAAFNPNGANPCGGVGGNCPGRDEGYLYWLAWLSHDGNSVFQSQDAHGVLRRIYFTASCDTILSILNNSPLGPVLTGIITGLGNPTLPGPIPAAGPIFTTGNCP